MCIARLSFLPGSSIVAPVSLEVYRLRIDCETLALRNRLGLRLARSRTAW